MTDMAPRPCWLANLMAKNRKKYNEQYEELPVKYKKLVRAVDIATLLVMIGLLAYPYLVYRR
jgi:hypothetical protein